MNAPATPPPSHGKSPALSTDYGSDVSSEELDEIVQSQVLQSTPCPPKKSQDMDRSATPSPSQSRAPMTPLPASQPVSSQMSSQPTPSSPTVPRLDLFTQPSLGRSYSPAPSQPSPSKSMTPRMESFAQPYTPPSSKYTLSGLPHSPYQVPQYWPMQPSYSQPPSSRLPPEVAVYRFPSGQLQGKTILEAPLHYFLLLKKDDQLRNSMPGLTEAMHLIDQSSSPVTPMPTPYMAPTPPSYEYATLSSSQPLPHAYMMSAGPESYQPVPQMHGIPAQYQHHPHIVPSSPTSSQHPYQDATPATPASSQPLPRQDMTDTPTSSQPSPCQDVKNTPSSSQRQSTASGSSQSQNQPQHTAPANAPSSSLSQSYRFDFGAHDGKTLVEVMKAYPGYTDHLKKCGTQNPKLMAAIDEYERLNPEPDYSQYRLSFSKDHKGKTLPEVPPEFIDWLIRASKIYKEDKHLRAAIKYFRESQTPSSSAKRRGSHSSDGDTQAKRMKQ